MPHRRALRDGARVARRALRDDAWPEQSLLEAYAARNNVARAEGPGGGQRFLYLTTWAGLGNRVLAVLSAFVLAILTDRILLLEESVWNGEHLFDAPIDWQPASWPAFVALRDRQSRTTATARLWTTIDTEEQPFPHLPALLCANLTRSFPQRVLALRSIGQYLVPLLLSRTAAPAPELSAALGDEPARHLMRFLLPPTAALRERVDREPSMRLRRPLVCVQLRMHNDWVRRGSPRLLEAATRCTSTMLSASPRLGRHTDQLEEASAANDKGGRSVHIATDNVSARAALSGALATEHSGVHVSFVREAAEAARQERLVDAWLELLVLARCDALLTTGGSTFGYLARVLAQGAPLHRQRYLTGWMDESEPFRTARHCPLLQTTEPCLMHAWRPDWDLRKKASCFVNVTPGPVRDHLIAPLGPGSQCF